MPPRATLSRPIAGAVIGFAISVEGQTGAIWVTGDTVLFRGVREVPQRLAIDTMVAHLGKVRFPISGSLTYSLSGADAIELAKAARPRIIIPVHFDGWSHFTEQRSELAGVLRGAPAEFTRTLVWPEPGQPLDL